MSAAELARELEVSTRTVLRDIDALSSTGIPVYAERGRHGGFQLLPGFTTDLTGLSEAEARALVAAGASATPGSLGMAPELAAAMRKVVAALPDSHRQSATRVAARILVRESGWYRDAAPEPYLALVQQAVFDGVRLRIRYASRGSHASTRTVDPVGLVFAAGRWYLLAEHRRRPRTYRLSRMEAVEVLRAPAERAEQIDLAAEWERRRSEFVGRAVPVVATVRVHRDRFDDLVSTAAGIVETSGTDAEWITATVEFADLGHASSVMWRLGSHGELLAPGAIRDAIRVRAESLAERYR